MKAVQLKSGLVVPKSSVEKPPEPPQRDWGLLEVRNEDSRKYIGEFLQKMINDSYVCHCGGGIVLPDTGKKVSLRKQMIILLGHALLGDDWTYYVKT